jgi:phage terminase large subunit-like protein
MTKMSTITKTRSTPSTSRSSDRPICRPLSGPRPLAGAPTRGPKVCAWIERHCIYGEGDNAGQQVKLDPFQRHFIYHLYRLKPNGERQYRRAMFEVPKGNGKTPIASWIGLYELCNSVSPVIPVAAASYKQADLLFGDLRTCASESPTLSEFLKAFENDVQRVEGPGHAYKVAAVAGTNDGQRPSVFLADEIHEWEGKKARVHTVIANGCSKRAGSLVMNTTTAGADIETLAGRMHTHGVRVNAGEIEDDEFLFIWYGAAETYDLEDPEQLEAAVWAANPAAGSFLRVTDVIARYYQIPRFEFERYHLCRWTTVGESWLPPGAWDAAEGDEDPIPDGADCVLAFDGSYNGDCTALSVASIGEKPRVELVALWERPENERQDWQVDILEVEEKIRETCRKYHVLELAADPYRWARSLQILADEGLPVVEFPQNASRMTPATTRFYEAVVNKQVTHSGDPRLSRHIANCALKTDSRGSRLSKDHRNSTRKIDAAITAVMALDRASAPRGEPEFWFVMD